MSGLKGSYLFRLNGYKGSIWIQKWVGALLLLLSLACGGGGSDEKVQPAPSPGIGSVTSISLPDGSAPEAITQGPDRKLWFTLRAAGKIGRISPTTLALEVFALPESNSEPTGITTGSDGQVWFTLRAAGKIGRISPTTLSIQTFALPDATSEPQDITAGPDGQIWFTLRASGKIGRISPSTLTIETFKLVESGSAPTGITAGPDGHMWFTLRAAGKIGRISPSTLSVQTIPLNETSSEPTSITTGPDGKLWFTLRASGKIGRISPSTLIPETFALNETTSEPQGLVSGSDGHLWFTMRASGKIGRISPSTLTMTSYPLPSVSSSPMGIALGPDGHLWSTLRDSSAVARMLSSSPSTSITVKVVPSSVSLTVGDYQPFTASVQGTDNLQVSWSVVEGDLGGTITSTGLYQAPSTPGTYHVRATSQADSKQFGEATVTVIEAPNIQSFKAEPSTVLFGGQSTLLPLFSGGTGWIEPNIGAVTSGQSIPTGILKAPQTYTLSVTNPLGRSTQTQIQVQVQAVTVKPLSPASPKVTTGHSIQFQSGVQGAVDANLLWKATAGSITSSGQWTAPSLPQIVTITAVSVADPTQQASTDATIFLPPVIEGFQAEPATVPFGGTSQLLAVFRDGLASLDPDLGAVESGKPVQTGALKQNTLFTLTVKNPANTKVHAELRVAVTPVQITPIAPAQPIVSVSDSLQFNATVTGAVETRIKWTASAGTINESGLWTAPSQAGSATITATSLADPTVSATVMAQVLDRPSIQEFKADPNPVLKGASTHLRAVFKGGIGRIYPLDLPILSGQDLETPPILEDTTFLLKVTNGAGSEIEAELEVQIQALTIQIHPSQAALPMGESLKFQAQVHAANPSVTWKVMDPEGGTVQVDGTYVAPFKVGLYQLRATSVQDPELFATVDIDVRSPSNEAWIAAGPSNSLALQHGGQILAWGANTFGQLSDGSTEHQFSPVMGAFSDIDRAFCSGETVLVLKHAGGVWAWGSNRTGCLGQGTQDGEAHHDPVKVELGSPALDLALSPTAAFALLEDGQIMGWGEGSPAEPRILSGFPGKVQRLAAGYLHHGEPRSVLYALLENGTVWCHDHWNSTNSLPFPVPGLDSVRAISARAFSFLALKRDGSLWRWDPRQPEKAAQAIPGLKRVLSMAAGEAFFLARDEDGSLWAWGRNSHGQLGQGSASGDEQETPLLVPGLKGVIAVAAGRAHALALLNDGSLWSWGWLNMGELGQGTSSLQAKPSSLQVSFNTTQVFGASQHSFARDTMGQFWGWGASGGLLGLGDSVPRPTPIFLAGSVPTTTLSTGWLHTLALHPDGTVWAWGANGSGELGDGQTIQEDHFRSTPVQVVGPSGSLPFTNASALAAGREFSLALRSDTTVWAWGSHRQGTLGCGPQEWTETSKPVQVKQSPQLPLSGIVTLAAGGSHALALARDGRIFAWGDNRMGQCGIPEAWSVVFAQSIQDVPSFAKVACGARHSLALSIDGRVWTWGANDVGQLGLGFQDSETHWKPTVVEKLPVIQDIATKADFSLALGQDGSLWGWGSNETLILESASVGCKTSAIQISGFGSSQPVINLSTGLDHALVSTQNGQLWTWGLNQHGQLGSGLDRYQAKPIQVKKFNLFPW